MAPPVNQFEQGISGGSLANQNPKWIIDQYGNAAFAGSVSVAGTLTLSGGSTTSETLANNEFLSGLTTANVVKRLIGVNTSNLVSIDPDAINVTFGGNIQIGGTDVILSRDAANTLALQNGVTSQEFRIYNTFTSSTNKEYAALNWTANIFQITINKGSGGGSQRGINIDVTNGAGTAGWTIAPTTAYFIPFADNGQQIGDLTHRASNVLAMTYTAMGDAGGTAVATSFSNATNATVTNAYIVKGGQGANTVNTGWMKIYIGTNAAWVPFWTNATP